MSDIVFQAQIPGVFAEETLLRQDFSMARRHLHESTELYFMLEGERYYFIEQDTYHVKQGMAVLINRDQIHKTSMVSGSTGHHRFLLQLAEFVRLPVSRLTSWLRQKPVILYSLPKRPTDQQFFLVFRLLMG